MLFKLFCFVVLLPWRFYIAVNEFSWRWIRWFRSTRPLPSPSSSSAPKCMKRVAIIGTGLSGIEALKVCAEHGIDAIAFESASNVGGFWRYNDSLKVASVHKSVHVNTDRDMNSFSDFPFGENDPIITHNRRVCEYLAQNVDAFELRPRIQFRRRVESAVPALDNDNGNDETMCQWDLRVRNLESGDVETMRFDGVLVCTGRHGAGGWVPEFDGLDKFGAQGERWVHSSHYKHPQKHGLAGKRVMVVGVGNSGLDVVTELAQHAASTVLVSRSGAWIRKISGPQGKSDVVIDRLTMTLASRLPWWQLSALQERTMYAQQPVLNRAGLEPRHRAWQQHMLVSSWAFPGNSLHEHVERGAIVVRHGIERFTERGTVCFTDGDELPIDFVVFATGFKQCSELVEPSIVDLRFERAGNDVLLYKHIWTTAKRRHQSLGYINFLQSASFLCAEVQCRVYCAALLGDIALPPLAEQRAEVEAIRTTLCAQYLDRSQLRSQQGMFIKYYDELAKLGGFYPSIGRLLVERPRALWHAWLTGLSSFQYRLAGRGARRDPEFLRAIERLHESQFYRMSSRDGPLNRHGFAGLLRAIVSALVLLAHIAVASCRFGPSAVGPRLEDPLHMNLHYARTHDTKHRHSLAANEQPADVAQLPAIRPATVGNLDNY
jgi:dimethylaniline monooxygenase (N-oxide forming) / hypotaurine monooxygenase